jgi:hypothetical protein
MIRTLLIFTLFSSSLQAQVQVSPDNEDILYTGRIEFTNPKAPDFSMNGVSIKANFEGSNLSAKLSSIGRSHLYVIIDEVIDPYNRKLIQVNGTERSFDLTGELEEGNHSIELIKLSEYDSKTTFHGFEIKGKGLVAKPGRPSLQLEFYGDSNTSGWNAWNAYDQGGSEASGAYYTFPGLVSRMLGAEYSLIGVGGSGITAKTWLDLTSKYDYIHIKDANSNSNTWNFDNNYLGFSPEAVIINLGANDYYADASKDQIKASWKNFIMDKIRQKYPETHIVLANSIGWAYNEPADYLNEAIEELNNEGEMNVSFVKFPWLWGQHHAVINEHAGFANILSEHLAMKLNLPAPTKSVLSSFAPVNSLKNGSFEAELLTGIADGWRPHNTFELISNDKEAYEGNKFVKLSNKGWINFATQVTKGSYLKFTSWAKAQEDNHTGYLRIEFKDQAQKTIASGQIQPDFTTEWKEFEVFAEVPDGTWSAWLILESLQNSTLFFDATKLVSTERILSIKKKTKLTLYPNPATNYLNLLSDVQIEPLVNVMSINGQLIHTQLGLEPIHIAHWTKGLYILKIEGEEKQMKFQVR